MHLKIPYLLRTPALCIPNVVCRNLYLWPIQPQRRLQLTCSLPSLDGRGKEGNITNMLSVALAILKRHSLIITDLGCIPDAHNFQVNNPHQPPASSIITHKITCWLTTDLTFSSASLQIEVTAHFCTSMSSFSHTQRQGHGAMS